MDLGLDQANLTRIIHEHMRDQYPTQWKELTDKGLYGIVASLIDGVVLAIEANNKQLALQLAPPTAEDEPTILEL